MEEEELKRFEGFLTELCTIHLTSYYVHKIIRLAARAHGIELTVEHPEPGRAVVKISRGGAKIVSI